MPWQPKDLMDTKREFLELALQEGANRRELCRVFGISPKTGYALIRRHAEQGDIAQACRARSTRPLSSPLKTGLDVEKRVVELRRLHPRWGGRKIAQRLCDLGVKDVPAPSTITDILRRNGLICEQASAAAEHWQRFEHEAPNSLWQIDFKGFINTPVGRCHPLTLLDDHSRFNLAIQACSKADTATVQSHLQRVFERYGLPVRINADNGGPWRSPKAPGALSELAIWMIRLGIRISHSRPYHPQTNGKLERFHRSLKAEVLNGRSFIDLPQAQCSFDRWREVYNHERPHEALNMRTPVSRYQLSNRAMPATLAPIEYGPDDHVVTVRADGGIWFQGTRLRVSNALHRLPVAIRPSSEADGLFDAYFCHHRIATLNLHQPTSS